MLADPERQLAINYATPSKRAALECLWRLDERMGAIVAAAREPAIGAMRLLWWRDALARLDDIKAPVPAEPLLDAAATLLVDGGLAGEALAGLEEGWAALLDSEEPGEAEIVAHGELRGARLFALSAQLLGGAPEETKRAGAGWALADLGHRLRDPDARRFARERALAALSDADIASWPGTLRPLGLLAVLARGDARMPPARLRRQGAPKRLLRALAYRLTGR
ncbi:hypothetical protein ASE00_08045 [Sphingomonas sp. Root710]|nr:hypothetical protein ASE00_08045 [Sphingomonas sp. Root710]